MSAVLGALVAAASMVQAGAGIWPPEFRTEEVCSLFVRNSSRALGMDAAYSVPLGEGGDSLWLFGDTYLGRWGQDGRRLVDGFIRNSALVTALGPEAACREEVGFVSAGPSAAEIMPSRLTWRGARFYWPLDGFRAPSGEVYFYASELRNVPRGMGFERVGVALFRWKQSEVRAERVARLWGREGKDWAFGQAVHLDAEEGMVYLFGCRNVDPAESGLYSECKLARVPVRKAGRRGAYRYFRRGKGWVRSRRKASVLFGDTAGELSVSYNEHLGRYLVVHTQTLKSNVVLRSAPELTGPWSEPLEVFRCSDPRLDPGLGCYAGKEHREWAEEGGRVIYLTYADNLSDDVKLVDGRFYWPHLLRVTFAK